MQALRLMGLLGAVGALAGCPAFPSGNVCDVPGVCGADGAPDVADAGDAGDGAPDDAPSEAADAGKPVHRLFVGKGTGVGQTGLVAWDDVDTIAQDRAPDVAFGDPGTQGAVTALEMVGNRLFGFDDANKKLFAIDDAAHATNGTAPSFQLGSSAFVGAGVPSILRMRYWAKSDLLFTTDPQSGSQTHVQIFPGASTMSPASLAKAMVGGAGSSYSDMAYLAATDWLLVGDPIAQTIHILGNASTATGQVTPAADFSPSTPFVPYAMVMDDVRLYVLAFVPPPLPAQIAIEIFNLAQIKAGSQPDATVTKGLPNISGSTPLDIALANDTLVVSYRAGPGDQLVVFPNAKSLGSQSQGTLLAPNDSIIAPRLCLSSKTGRLYIAGTRNNTPGLFVYDGLTTTPTLRASLLFNAGSPAVALALYEP